MIPDHPDSTILYFWSLDFSYIIILFVFFDIWGRRCLAALNFGYFSQLYLS